MRRFLLVLALFLFLFLMIPLLFALIPSPATPEAIPVSDSVTFIPSEEITLWLTDTNETLTVELEACVADILCRELSETVPSEAAKAQAVAVRSNLLNKIYSMQASSAHPTAMLCDDPDHCMEFTFAAPQTEIAAQAIQETRGQYLTYNNLPARCFYFNISAGMTESALDVWGLDLPYLTSVESPYDRLGTYQSRVIYPLEAVHTVLRGARPHIALNETHPLGAINRTEAGHVKTVKLYHEVFTGEEIKNLFHLKSTNFTLRLQNEQVIFQVKGDGHGVGMSKFGAESMAKNGDDYMTILNYYYPGTIPASPHQID